MAPINPYAEGAFTPGWQATTGQTQKLPEKQVSTRSIQSPNRMSTVREAPGRKGGI